MLGNHLLTSFQYSLYVDATQPTNFKSDLFAKILWRKKSYLTHFKIFLIRLFDDSIIKTLFLNDCIARAKVFKYTGKTLLNNLTHVTETSSSSPPDTSPVLDDKEIPLPDSNELMPLQ